MPPRKKFLFLKFVKSHPQQAGFIRRGLAWLCDMILIVLISSVLYIAYTEIKSLFSEEKGIATQIVEKLRDGVDFSMVIGGTEREKEGTVRSVYLDVLETRLSPEDYARAREMTSEEMKGAFPKELEDGRAEERLIITGEEFNIFTEIVIGYIYFTLFFRFGGRTPGKRIFRLKVIDLKKSRNLGWYQAFERAHGYSASILLATLGFLQVLWMPRA